MQRFLEFEQNERGHAQALTRLVDTPVNRTWDDERPVE
jgi:hypothetical protein